jgi:hypothetical protein
MSFRTFIKRFGYDIAGYICLIVALPIGALPGPGGIPIIIAGLGLLSVHNPWAKSLLGYVRKHSESFRAILFPKNKLIETVWDIAGGAMLITAILVACLHDIWQIRALSTSLATLSVMVLLSNRSRIDSLTKKIKR